MRHLKPTVSAVGTEGLCNMFLWLNAADAVITWHLVHSGRSFELNPFMEFMLNWGSSTITPLVGFVALKMSIAGAIATVLYALRKRFPKSVRTVLRGCCAGFAAIVLFNLAQLIL